MSFVPGVTPSLSRGPPACRVCTHADRARIEMLLVSGITAQTIVRQFKGLSRYSVNRHKHRHISSTRRAQLLCGPVKLHELVDRATDESMSLLDSVKILRSSLTHAYLTTVEAADFQNCSTIAGRLLEVLRLHAQLTGELLTATSAITVNNTVNNLSVSAGATVEDVLAAWRAPPAPTSPPARPPASLAASAVAVPAADLVDKQVVRCEAHPVSPASRRDDPAIDAVPDSAGVWSAPDSTQPAGAHVMGEESWRRVASNVVPIGRIPTPQELRAVMMMPPSARRARKDDQS